MSDRKKENDEIYEIKTSFHSLLQLHSYKYGDTFKKNDKHFVYSSYLRVRERVSEHIEKICFFYLLRFL